MGKRSFRELLDALDDLPERCLVPNAFEADGAFCALGSVARARGMAANALPQYDEEDCDSYGIAEETAAAFKIPKTLAAQIMEVNDDIYAREETPEQRWVRVRQWVTKRLHEWEWPKAPTVAP